MTRPTCKSRGHPRDQVEEQMCTLSLGQEGSLAPRRSRSTHSIDPSVRAVCSNAPAPRWCCPPATLRPCSFILTRLAPRLPPACTPFSSSIKSDGVAPKTSASSNNSLLSLPSRASEPTTKKTSGSSCGKTDCQTAFSTASMTSSITAAAPGALDDGGRTAHCGPIVRYLNLVGFHQPEIPNEK